MTAYPRSSSFGKVAVDGANMKQFNTILSLLVGPCFLLAACGETPPGGQGDPARIAEPTAPATTDPATIAKRVVADFLSLPASEITLVSVEAKDFGDPSLGCPEPGMSYPQVITPGHRVVVEADDRRFDVRVSGISGKICRKPGNKGLQNKSGETPPEHTSPITSQVDHARADLAAQLDLDPEDIDVVDVRPFAPNIAAPGCTPDCGNENADCGYLIGLFFDGRRYEYHATDDSAVACPPLLPI